MSQSSSDVIFAYLESANMSIPTFRQYFVQFPKRIIGNLCTVRKRFWHSAMYNTATASLPDVLRYGRLSDHHFTVKPAKINLLLLWDIIPSNRHHFVVCHTGISEVWLQLYYIDDCARNELSDAVLTS